MPSRNDPCPCGSGKKYKACHQRADQIASRTDSLLGDAQAFAEAAAEEAARKSSTWQADVVPLLEAFGDTGEPGAVQLVMAGGLILVADVQGRRPRGVQDRAEAILTAVMAGAQRAGVLPSRLEVRDRALEDALRRDAESRGMTVVAAPLPDLDAAVDDSLEHLMESAAGGAACAPHLWVETEASPKELAEFHAAAAAYHRAAPWRLLDDSHALLLTFPGDAEPWAGAVMGSAEMHHGLALYSDPGDLRVMLEREQDVDDFVQQMRGITLSVSYDRPADVPRARRREVASARWDLASPDAYPGLLGMGIPGRRIDADLVRRAALACRAVAGLVTAGDVPIPWRDPSTGVEVDLFDGAGEEEDDGNTIRLPWPELRVSHPVGPAGRNADPQAVLRLGHAQIVAGETARLKRFVAWLAGQKTSRAARERLVRTAETWADMLASQCLPAQSVTEFDLRLFLYSYVPRFAAPTKVMGKHLTRSLARLFEFYAEQEEIEYPWAAAALAELDAIAAGADDVRDVLDELAELFPFDLLHRVVRPVAEVAGTRGGWTLVPFDAQLTLLREELHRHWLLWHDEGVRGGITDPHDLREVLTGRQRQWENTPHPRLGGRTPKQVLIEYERTSHPASAS